MSLIRRTDAAAEKRKTNLNQKAAAQNGCLKNPQQEELFPDGKHPKKNGPLLSLQKPSSGALIMNKITTSSIQVATLFIILFCSKILLAASLAVTAPATGATWYKGQNYTITWTSSGVTGNVKLHLYKGGNFLVPISNNQSNTGSYSPFNPGSDLVDGTDYQIRMVDVNTETISASSGNFTIKVQAATAGLAPLYRLYKSNSGSTIRDHFYTTSKAEADNAVANLGYSSEGIECYIANANFNGALPLYRLYKSSSTSHYYTTSDSEKTARVANDGYAFEKIEGYVSGSAAEGLVGLHRLRQQSTVTPDHYFLTSKKHEYDAVKGGVYGPYTEDIPEGIGYAYPTGLREPTAHRRPQGNYEGVDLASGAFTGYASLDLSLKGRGPQLSFSHHYNSFNFNQHPLAQGWSHNLESYIVEDVNGNVTVKWGDGTVSYFEKTGAGVSDYLDKSGAHDILTRQIDGMNYGYDLKKKNQTTFNFRRFNVNPLPGTLPENRFLTDSDRFKIALITIKDWAERKLTLDHEAAYGTIIEARDDLGRKYVFRYDTVPRRLIRVEEQVEGALKRAISFGYNDQGLLSTYTDAEGKVTRYFYNGYGLLESIQYPMGNTITIGYSATTQQVESMKDGEKPPASIQYNITPNVTQVTDPRGKIFSYTHDAFKLTAQQGQGEANPARFVYGNPLNFTKPTHTEDKMGYSTDYEYDAMGNVKKITNARLNVANYGYNDKNNLTSAEEFHAADVSVTPTVYQYDPTGYRLDRITNPKNEATKLIHNANKQVEKIINGLEQETLIQYDRFGNPWKITDAEGNTTQYDNDWAGRTNTVIDGESKQTRYEFDNNDHLTRIINHRNLTVDIPYNDNGLQDKVRWSNEGTVSQTGYHYNSQNQLDTLTNPLSVNSTYGYNAAGLLETVTDFNGVARTYNYDDRNRLQNIVYSDHTTIFGHNANGLVSSVTAPAGGGSLIEYNELNLIKKVTDPFGKIIHYVYDTASRLSTITYPGDKVVTYLYDAAGRLEYVNDWVGGSTRYIYDAAGNLKEIQRPNGTKAVYEYDLASRLTGITEKKADDTVICAYAYNNLNGVGNPRSVTATEPLTADVPDADIAYVRDLRSNHLTAAGAASYTYDNNGNRKTMVIGSDTTTYGWDGDNMLTSISGAGKSIQYAYDGMSNRIARTQAGVTTRYVLDLSGDMSKVLAETDEGGNVTAYYVYGIGLLSRITTSGTQSFYHYNNRGDAIALTDDAGNMTDKYAYDEYGKLMASEGTTSNPFKYVGRYGVMDEGGNFYFMRARYYDATVGRFLNEDLLGFEGGDWNLFAYVEGNPVTRIDPGGKAKKDPTHLQRQMQLIKESEEAEKAYIRAERKVQLIQYANMGLSSVSGLAGPAGTWTNLAVNTAYNLYYGNKTGELKKAIWSSVIDIGFEAFTGGLEHGIKSQFENVKEYKTIKEVFHVEIKAHGLLKDWLKGDLW